MEPTSTPDLEQLKRWADGRDPMPDMDLDRLKELGAVMGAARVQAREEAVAFGKGLKVLIPLLYRAGETQPTELARIVGLTRRIVSETLDKAGIVALPSGRQDLALQDDAA